MDSYINVQLDLNQRIQKGIRNFKKSPKERLGSCEYISTRLEELEKQWAEFTSTHTQIIHEFDEKLISASTYITTGVYDETEDLFIDYKCALKAALSKLKSNTQTPVSSKESTASKSKSTDLIKLPKISIPSFSGKYSEWISFRDLFVSLIDKNESLDNVQKLHYLKGHLTGEAEQLLRHVQITQDNYQICWKQLEKRYNNKKYLSNCILKRLLSQKNIVMESASALKELLDTTNECLYSLRNLGIDISTWDIIVIHIVCLKLDSESRKQWELKVSESSDDLPTLKQFQEFLENRFRALEFIDPKLSKTNIGHKFPNVSVSANPKVHHVIDISCAYCSESHKLCNCKGFAKLDVDTRRGFIQTNNLCFNCLGSSHNAFSCRQFTRCGICKRKHHSLLHSKNIAILADSEVKASQSVEKNVATHTTTVASSSDDPTSSVTACVSTSRSQVLLATALVSAQSKSGSGVTLRCLLDQGSQASFITESAVQLLGLKKIPHTSKISGLGSDGSTTMASKAMVNVKIASLLDPEFEVEINAFVLGKLTSVLPDRRIVVELWSELSNLELADPSFNIPSKIDLLLGADIYGRILLDGIIRAPLGAPIAQRTSLGWILSGPIHSGESEFHKTISVNHIHVNENELLKKFYELEADSVVSDPKMHFTD